jgi:thiosulfate/3-mercaptopyruvate sulfurtransferase
VANYHRLLTAEELRETLDEVVVLDCRFELGDPAAGIRAYASGHIPGAHYLHLERDLSGPVARHGGRHPLPEPAVFSDCLARLGVNRNTPVVVYDDNGFMPAARLWWMMTALNLGEVRLLDGGFSAWTAAGFVLDGDTPRASAVEPAIVGDYRSRVDVEGVRRALAEGALLVDSRDVPRYQGLEEPIDPVAGHIPGALNLPWQGVTDDEGFALDEEAQLRRLATLEEGRDPVVYCGSGVSACVNLLALHLVGRDDARLYAGSWSDWCSHMMEVSD